MNSGSNLLDKVFNKAKQNPQKVAFPEAEDPKMLKAIDQAAQAGLCSVFIVSNTEKIKQTCAEQKIDDQKWTYVDIADTEYQEKVLTKYLKLPNIYI